ncbi:hypothetical protein BSKO_05298 [Bryopsis sp. KO-2023]|nr:hypothetical protein BSKO_05298 [Bryopsis sp. KO-2023]
MLATRQGLRRCQRACNAHVVQEELKLLSDRIVSSFLAGPSSTASVLWSTARQVRGLKNLTGAGWRASGGVTSQRLHLSEVGRGWMAPEQFSGANSGIFGTLAVRQFLRGMCKTPKKGFEKFYPKGKPVRPGGSSGGGGGDKKGDNNSDMFQIRPAVQGIIMATLFSMTLMVTAYRPDAQEISFQTFKTELLSNQLVERVEVVNKTMVRVYVRQTPPQPKPDQDAIEDDMVFDKPKNVPSGQPPVYKFFFHIGSVDSFERQLEVAQQQLGWKSEEYIPVKYTTQWNLLQEILRFAPTLLLIGAYFWFTRQSMGALGGGSGGGRNWFNVGKVQVSKVDKNAKDKVTFKDVAGCDEAKVEVMEFVNFLKAPAKYKDLGARIPKGALLVGPPGTGKTLLAKATAGEANVPFLSISGSDFIEMFVGIGPARVRDLFSQARAQSPSIIFIDEIDAIGRSRGRGGFAGANDERESTLNQLLVEMDGFQSSSGVVVLAGTNRPDILDKALMRPGRFDRQITIDTPDITGREQIFRVHLAKIKLVKPLEYYSERLAALTPGFAGADIANVCNEAALIAAREGKEVVDLKEFEAAVDRVIGGLEKKNKVISKAERKTVAYHESGHAVVSWFLEYAEPLMKVSIVPRGTAALGFAQYLPSENLLATTEQMHDTLCMALGGRAAEQVLLGKISTGAQNDLEKVTKMAYAQVGVYGMSEKVGLLSFPQEDNSFNKPYSEATARLIDEEVRQLVDGAYKRTIGMVQEKSALIKRMAEELLTKEVLSLEDVERLLGPRPFKNEEMRNIDKFRLGMQSNEVEDITESPEEKAADGTGGGGAGAETGESSDQSKTEESRAPKIVAT